MEDVHVRHAVYIVGWGGVLAPKIKLGPNGEKAPGPYELEQQLQDVANAAVAGTGRSIAVHVVDARVIE
jgi:hypothetical protein